MAKLIGKLIKVSYDHLPYGAYYSLLTASCPEKAGYVKRGVANKKLVYTTHKEMRSPSRAV